MKYSLPPMPYDYKALQPHISEETLQLHYGKHHQGYVNNLNNLVGGESPLANKELMDIVKATHNDAKAVGIFNNAAQVWNHTFFWDSMKPNGGGAPTGELAAKIDNDLGGFDNFTKKFKEAGAGVFGSGYAWLVLRNGKLEVVKSPNAHNPILDGDIPLLTIDVWEHAYYLDYNNRRPDFIAVFLEKLVNWEFAQHKLAQAPNR